MRANLRTFPRAIAIAALSTIVTIALRSVLGDVFDLPIPVFLPMILAVFVSAWLSGWEAGIAATAICSVLGVFLSPATTAEQTPIWLRVFFFVVEGLTITVSLEATHRARLRLMQKKTELEKEVQERLRVEQELKVAARRTNEYLATLAHELRNPLAPMRHCLTLIEMANSDGHVWGQAYPVLKRQLDHMVRLVDDLLDLARITQDRLNLCPEFVEIGSIVQMAVETINPLIQASSHVLTVQIPETPIIVEGDAARLTQVFGNLLHNAAKYMDRGGSIHVTVCEDEGEVKVTVKDAGIGIAPENLPHIFEMFTQVGRSKGYSQGGLGVGLCLTKRLVEMHGGSIAVESLGAGRGSEFTVWLPITHINLHPKKDKQPGLADSVAHTQQRILVVDDNEDTALTLVAMLEAMGYEARSAPDGVQALSVAENFRPELVLMDIGMPNMNGCDAARELRSRPWSTDMIIVAYTGWGPESEVVRWRKAGFDHYLVKPASTVELRDLLGKLRRSQALSS
jgi:signal transduction histidine kinase/CheY-like chemotaxis protein